MTSDALVRAPAPVGDRRPDGSGPGGTGPAGSGPAGTAPAGPLRRGLAAPSGSVQVLVLVVLAWMYVVVPRMISSVQGDKQRVAVGDPVVNSPLSILTEKVLAYGLMAWCVAVALLHVRRLPTDRRVAVLVLLAPWAYVVCRDLYADHQQDKPAWIYPLLVLAVWVLRPSIERLAAVGVLAALTAAASIVLAFVAPSKGIFVSAAGTFVSADKELLPIGILVGPFTAGNNLAQVTVLGLPCLALLRSGTWRAVLAVPMVVALVWTSSRSSLAAAALGILVVPAVLLAVRRRARAFPTGVVLGLLALAVMVIPLVTSEPDAFTNRGVIWVESLRSWWGENIAFGLGSNWYGDAGAFGQNILPTAFHGHNQFVHVVVTMGLAGAALVALLTVYAIVVCARWAAERSIVPAVFLATLLVSCTLEVTFGFVDRTFILCAAQLGLMMIVLADRRSWAAGRAAGT